MKFNKNFIVPIILSIISGIMLVIIQGLPVSLALEISLFMIIPILLIQKKTNNNWGAMLIFGMIIIVLFIAIWTCTMFLASHNEWLGKILSWPSSM